MQYLVAAPANADRPLLEQALQSVDPAALLDLDPEDGRLRISTWMTRDELGGALAAAGMEVTGRTLVQLPSACCGGCGG